MFELDAFLEEFLAWKEEQGDPVSFVERDGVYWLTVGDRLHRLGVTSISIADARDPQVVVVECALGVWSDRMDARQLLLLSGAQMVLSRFSLCPRGNDDVLVIESAAPANSLNFPLFDRMLREVLSLGAYLLNAEGS